IEAAVRHLGPDNASAVLYRPTTSSQVAGSREEMRLMLDHEPRPQGLGPPAPYQARALRPFARKPASACIERLRECRFSCEESPARRSCTSASMAPAARVTKIRRLAVSPRSQSVRR